MPYEVVSSETWEHIMPRWLEAIVMDVPARELNELKLLLRYFILKCYSHLNFKKLLKNFIKFSVKFWILL